MDEHTSYPPPQIVSSKEQLKTTVAEVVAYIQNILGFPGFFVQDLSEFHPNYGSEFDEVAKINQAFYWNSTQETFVNYDNYPMGLNVELLVEWSIFHEFSHHVIHLATIDSGKAQMLKLRQRLVPLGAPLDATESWIWAACNCPYAPIWKCIEILTNMFAFGLMQRFASQSSHIPILEWNNKECTPPFPEQKLADAFVEELLQPIYDAAKELLTERQKLTANSTPSSADD